MVNPYGTSTDAAVPEDLTLEIMMEAIAKVGKNPMEKLANDHGFSLDAGDMMLVSREIDDRTNVSDCHTNIRPSNLLGPDVAIFLKRTPNPWRFSYDR